MIQGPYVVEISRRVDTLGSVLFQEFLIDISMISINLPHKSVMINA